MWSRGAQVLGVGGASTSGPQGRQAALGESPRASTLLRWRPAARWHSRERAWPGRVPDGWVQGSHVWLGKRNKRSQEFSLRRASAEGFHL